VLCLAVESRRTAQVVAYARQACEAGLPTVLVSSVQLVNPPVPPGATYVNLAPAERRLLLNRLLLSWPVRLLLALLRVRGGREALWARWSKGPRYRRLRPWMHWRSFRRTAKRLDLATFTHVVIGGVESWPIAWHVSRANPDVVVDFSLDAPALAGRAAERA
jgi:hypothetical protein